MNSLHSHDSPTKQQLVLKGPKYKKLLVENDVINPEMQIVGLLNYAKALVQLHEITIK